LSKTLLRDQNVLDYVDNNQKTLFVTKDMILTPGAKDLLRNQNISILYESDHLVSQDPYENKSSANRVKIEPSSSSKSKEEDAKVNQMPLSDHIKLLLRNEFGILKEVEVQKIAKIVLEVLRENGEKL